MRPVDLTSIRISHEETESAHLFGLRQSTETIHRAPRDIGSVFERNEELRAQIKADMQRREAKVKELMAMTLSDDQPVEHIQIKRQRK